jgi:hypothetical protein
MNSASLEGSPSSCKANEDANNPTHVLQISDTQVMANACKVSIMAAAAKRAQGAPMAADSER